MPTPFAAGWAFPVSNGDGRISPDLMELHRLVARGGYGNPAAAAPTLKSVLSILSHDPGALFRTDANRMIPLHLACESGASVEIVEALADGADEERGRSIPFDPACTYRPSLPLVEWKDLRGRMPLHVACQSDRASPEVVRLLVNRGPSAMGMVDKSSQTPLHHACSRPSAMADSIKLLVDRCPDALFMRGCGYVRSMAPLHVLCRYGGSTDLVRLLAEAKPEVTAWRDGGGQTPLMYAVERWAPLGTVRALVEESGTSDKEAREALGSTRDGCSWTPLHVACDSKGPWENAMYLAERHPGALDEKDWSGRTPPDLAAPGLGSLLDHYRLFLRNELDGQGLVHFF